MGKFRHPIGTQKKIAPSIVDGAFFLKKKAAFLGSLA